MATLEEVKAEIDAQAVSLDAVTARFADLKTQVAAALVAANVSAETQAKIDGIFASAQTNTAKIAALAS